MNESPAWVQIVQFIRDFLQWPIEAQSAASHISSTNLYEWCRGRRVPGVRNWSLYMRWVLSLSAVRNYSANGSWAMPDSRFSHRHQVYLMTSLDRWMVLYYWDGDLLEIDSGQYRRDQSLDHLLVELSEMTAIRMEEIEQENEVKCA